MMEKAIQIEYDGLFEYKCACAAAVGFKSISVNYTRIPTTESEDGWKRITEDIQRILEENKLGAVQTHPHYYDLRISSEIVDEDMEFAMRQSIISSAALGAKYCVFHPRSSITSGYLRSRSLVDNIKWFSSLLECAAKYGTSIAAENLPIFRTDGRRMPFFSTGVEDLSDLVDALGDERAVVCWDFGHANMMHYDQRAAISHLGSRIKCTHIHNNFTENDTHSSVDCGNIPWDEVMPALVGVGYDGPLTLETKCYYESRDMLRSFIKFNFATLEYLEGLCHG